MYRVDTITHAGSLEQHSTWVGVSRFVTVTQNVACKMSRVNCEWCEAKGC
jgi:hypothetical protein